jgi:REP element-mobilizing transposase RayT
VTQAPRLSNSVADTNQGPATKVLEVVMHEIVVHASGVRPVVPQIVVHGAGAPRHAEQPVHRPAPASDEPPGDFIDPRTTSFVDLRSRGQLPHLYKEGGSYFVTFRLWDAVIPLEKRRTKGTAGETPALQDQARAGETPALQWRRRTREELVAQPDSPLQLGSCWLGKAEIALMVQNCLKHFHGHRYHLHAWCVMPNHVHVVYTALGDHLPKDIHHSWKSYTAHEANKLLRRRGSFWERESFDHLIRSAEDLEWFIDYVEKNPVAAGLCHAKEEWPWSSASSR